jgi:hypothetical protein
MTWLSRLVQWWRTNESRRPIVRDEKGRAGAFTASAVDAWSRAGAQPSGLRPAKRGRTRHSV